MQTPRFSIIIPMYNVEKFIARAIESAINQSYKNIEIICVDDCGGDKSAEIAKEFALKDSRVKVLQNAQNLGTYATRNNGAISAKGEYLLFLDADDYLELNACEVLNNALNQMEEGIDILAFNFAQNSSQSKKSHILHPQNALFSIKDFVLYIAQRGVGKYWSLCNKAFLRTTYVKSLQNLDLDKRLLMAEDALNFINMLFYAKNYACISDELYIYYKNENSITQRNDIEKLNLTIENHRYVINTLLEQSNRFLAFEKYLAQIFCIELEISNINFAKRKLNKSLLNYLKTSFYKKFLRFKQKRYVHKLSIL